MLMDAYALMLPLMLEFVNCFTTAGFAHFRTFVTAHAALLGLPHCVTEAMRLTQVHKIIHWTTPYAFMSKGKWSCKMVSRLRTDARLYEPPPKSKPGKRGPKPKKGKKVSAKQLWRRKSKRRKLKVNIYGKTVTIEAFVDVVIASPTLGYLPILVVIFPQRSGKKMNVFFTTDLTMSPQRLLEIYGARFKIEDTFGELKTVGGFGDYRQRSFTAIKRHVTLSMVAYSLLRLLSVTLKGAEAIEAEPWWSPPGPPSVTRLRRAVFKAFRITCSLHSAPKVDKIMPLKKAA
jgi:hypothetical protein